MTEKSFLNFIGKIDTIYNSNTLQLMKSHFLNNMNSIITDIKQICEIPAPSFYEERRIEFIKKYFDKIQYESLVLKIDKYKNIIIRYPGKESIAKICILAHLDTVFPEETLIKVVSNKNFLSAPGIGDNSTSVGCMLNIIKTWIDTEYTPPFDVLFVGNACEEGLGDLKGTKGFLDDYCSRKDVDLNAFLALDGPLNRITHVGTGVKRFKVTIETDGGHSWGDFGKLSSIHILGKIISKISQIKAPLDPKTTYNVGLIEGGTSINTIAQKASMFIDLRSKDSTQLEKLENNVLSIINENTKGIKRDIEVVGDRPSGSISKNHPIVQITKKIADFLEIETEFSVSSTDANIPLSRNIPAIAIGCYMGYGAHTLEEKIEIDSLKKGIPYVNSCLIALIEWIQQLNHI